ncbi:hypothetical protein B0H63DRAFT_443093 [Podospora didyma]|uniref:Uncharacterized protein n=1 Tax=Podospora didyma TaxID=330526 RepID=A0AAE0P3I7_9PEZI|nr:hypothetical protein B0H63DRAFT_443093 [Podospora didyma]
MKYDEVKEKVAGNQSRSILALNLQDTEKLNPEILTETSDQVRSFVFTGHGSNTSLMQWVFYELSRTPRALKAVGDELDSIFSPETRTDTAALYTKLMAPRDGHSGEEDMFTRRYDFVKVGLGESALDGEGRPALNERGQYKVKAEMYNTRRMIAKPIDGVRMKVRFAGGTT